jgi:lipoprotein signal peptidase
MWKLAGLLVILDQVLKAISLNYIRAWGTNPFYVFEWNMDTLMYSDWLGLLIIVGLVLFLGRKMLKSREPIVWAVLLFSGLASNLIDGVHWSAVIDYIHVPGTPYRFNLADFYVLAGAAMLLMKELKHQGHNG